MRISTGILTAGRRCFPPLVVPFEDRPAQGHTAWIIRRQITRDLIPKLTTPPRVRRLVFLLRRAVEGINAVLAQEHRLAANECPLLEKAAEALTAVFVETPDVNARTRLVDVRLDVV